MVGEEHESLIIKGGRIGEGKISDGKYIIMSEKKERRLLIKIGEYVIDVRSFGSHVCHVSL